MPPSLARFLRRLRDSRGFRENTINSGVSMLDYLVPGIAMLLAASFLVHRFGLSQYGLWMLAIAVISSMESLSSGFGDATVRFVSRYRGRGDAAGVTRVVQATLAINAVLGAVLAAAVVIGAGFAVTHVFHVDPPQQALSTRILQVAGVILLFRSIENVYANTLRAFERYARTALTSIVARILNIGAAVVAAWSGHTVLTALEATLAISVVTLGVQVAGVRALCGPAVVVPRISRESFREIADYGVFSWLQSMTGVIYYHADRLVVGALLGPAALGVYAICVQATQPIHGLSSAALNFIFPHVSARRESGTDAALASFYHVATWLNLGFVLVLAAPLLFFGREILAVWMGPAFADRGAAVLLWLTIANASLAASVVSHYILLAMGQARFVALVNILGGILSLACIGILIPLYGLPGAALGRLAYSAATALNVWRLRGSGFVNSNSPQP